MNKEELIKYILNNDDIELLTEKLSLYLGNPLVLIAPSLSIIAYSKTHQVPDNAWHRATERGYITLEFGTVLNNWDEVADRNLGYLTVESISEYQRRFYKLTYKSKLVGYLNVAQVNQPYDAVNESEYELACDILAKEIAGRGLSIQINRNIRNEDILTALIHHEYVDRLHYLGIVRGSVFEKETGYRIICVDIHDHYGYNAIDDLFKNELIKYFRQGIMTISEGVITIAWPGDNKSPELKSLHNKIADFLKRNDLCIGISELFYDMYRIEYYRKQALYALNHRKKERFCLYSYYQIQNLLDHIPKAELMNYCHEDIRGIYHYDKKQQTEYLITLEEFLKSGHSVKKTSYNMRVHRNTVNYRLNRIRELFDLDLDDASLDGIYMISCEILKRNI